jgi:hypothetical protein
MLVYAAHARVCGTCSCMYTSCRASTRIFSRSLQILASVQTFVCVFSFCVGVVCTACACFLYAQTHTHTAPPDIPSITAGGQVRDCKTEHRLKRLNARYIEAIEWTLQSLLLPALL